MWTVHERRVAEDSTWTFTELAFQLIQTHCTLFIRTACIMTTVPGNVALAETPRPPVMEKVDMLRSLTISLV